MHLARKHALSLLCLLAAFAAIPAAAQAEDAYWYDQGAKVGAEASIDGEVGSFLLKGNLSGTGFNIYCTVEYNGMVSNEPAAGAGQVEAASFSGCGTEFPEHPSFVNCWAEINADNTPWSLNATDTTGEGFRVEVSQIDVTISFYTFPEIPPPTPACPVHGNTYRSTGAITGSWANGAPSTVHFEEAPGLTVFFGGTPIGTSNVTAAFNITGAEGSAITLDDM